MADDDGAAGEVFQRFFQRADRVDVQIVGRLVEQEDVRAALEHAGEVDAVALAAGEDADFLLLVGAGEAEAADVGAGVHLRAGAELERLLPVADRLPDGRVVLAGCRATARRRRASRCRRP